MVILISSDRALPGETDLATRLMQNGVDSYHLRKPGADIAVYEEFIQAIPKRYRSLIVVHEHPELLSKYALKGIHLNSRLPEKPKGYKGHLSRSCHSMDDLLALKEGYDYVFLSPVFNSISKKKLKSPYTLEDLKTFLWKNQGKLPRVIALGGIQKGRARRAMKAGFDGVALMGYIWCRYERKQNTAKALKRFIKLRNKVQKPYVLSLGGYDPSGGAGVLADVKTMERNKVQGLAVSTSLTYQNEKEFSGLEWHSTAQIKKQLDTLLKGKHLWAIKIGLIENVDVLSSFVEYLHERYPASPIVWDPVLKASAGFRFHESVEKKKLEKIMHQISLMTPNKEEADQLFEGMGMDQLSGQIFSKGLCPVLISGGNGEEGADDVLLTGAGEYHYPGKKFPAYAKHGSGCVYSSAVAAQLARGKKLKKACKKAKRYTEKFLLSNKTKLGYHVK